jgi:hypothetical protein
MIGTGRCLYVAGGNSGRAELDSATAESQAVFADPAATRADRVAAIEREMALFDAYEQKPGGEAELQAAAELEAGI